MVGGVAGGDIMKGFSGDDIMLGQGSFTKFIGGLGWDWAPMSWRSQGVDEDMNRKEFVAVNGAEDSIRDICQHTEGVSGSAFDDILKGDQRHQAAGHQGRARQPQSHRRPRRASSHPGLVSFDAGNIMLGGEGNDMMIGGGGDDIIDGDAFLHVGLTSYSAGAQIIRQIL